MPNDEIFTEPDYANDLGEAFHARPSSVETVGGEWRGQFRDGGVAARVMRDSTVHDVLRNGGLITAAQHEAADRLYGFWCSGGFEGATTGGYGVRAYGASTDDDGPSSADEYRATLRRMPAGLAVRIDALMLFQYRPEMLSGVRDALGWCVREWGL